MKTFHLSHFQRKCAQIWRRPLFSSQVRPRLGSAQVRRFIFYRLWRVKKEESDIEFLQRAWQKVCVFCVCVGERVSVYVCPLW